MVAENTRIEEQHNLGVGFDIDCDTLVVVELGKVGIGLDKVVEGNKVLGNNLAPAVEESVAEEGVVEGYKVVIGVQDVKGQDQLTSHNSH